MRFAHRRNLSLVFAPVSSVPVRGHAKGNEWLSFCQSSFRVCSRVFRTSSPSPTTANDMAAMEGTYRKPAFNPFQFDRVSTAPFILSVTHPLSFARKRARRARPRDFPLWKAAAARASPPATVPVTTRDTQCRQPILRGMRRAFFSARRETSRVSCAFIVYSCAFIVILSKVLS